MSVLLLFSLILLLFLSYKLNKSVVAPSFLVIAIFSLSTLITTIHTFDWHVNFSITTSLLILCSLAFFLAGEQLGKNVSIEISAIKQEKGIIEKPIVIKPMYMFLVCVGMLVFAILYFNASIQLAYKVGYSGGDLALRYVRLAKTVGYTVDGVVGWLYIFATCVAYLLIYNTIKNIFKFKLPIRKFLLDIVSILLYMATTILTTGRTEIMYVCIYAFILYLVFSSKDKKHVLITPKVLGISILIVTVFFVSFYMLGNLTGKSQIMNLEKTISVYVGGSIAALNDFCDNIRFNDGPFGQHTLFGVYTFLDNLGFDVKILERPLEFVRTGSLTTNIYTALRRYLQDFGYVGCVAVMSFIGFFYGRLFHGFSRQTTDWRIILYSMSAFVLIEMAIEERFFMSLITPIFLYRIIIMYAIYFVIQRSKKYRKKGNDSQ